jgi:hypothetical protein
MWLLDTTTLKLHHFQASPEEYAIFSHTWGEDEVTFRDMKKDLDAAKHRLGWSKVSNCCRIAKENGFQYVWIDNCCIDKKSSAELSEAINSMWKWYKNSSICFAYLGDVPPSGYDASDDHDQFSQSRWFTRGWTLQELLAPRVVMFLAQNWAYLGTKGVRKNHLADQLGCLRVMPGSDQKNMFPATSHAGKLFDKFMERLENITGIGQIAQIDKLYQKNSIATRMSWASKRQTTRPEDRAYSLMGIFDVNMPIIYGEGLLKAFRRLLIEILQSTTDQSILAWKEIGPGTGILPSHPDQFQDCDFGHFMANRSSETSPRTLAMSVTNIGINVVVLLQSTYDPDIFYASLRCCSKTGRVADVVNVILKRLTINNKKESNIYIRINHDRFIFSRRFYLIELEFQEILILHDEFLVQNSFSILYS